MLFEACGKIILIEKSHGKSGFFHACARKQKFFRLFQAQRIIIIHHAAPREFRHRFIQHGYAQITKIRDSGGGKVSSRTDTIRA